MEVHLSYGKISAVCEIPDEPTIAQTTIGVDLGVNTLIAATDGETAILINGREAKASVQWRNQKLASLQTKQSKHQRGSRRHKRPQRRKYKPRQGAQPCERHHPQRRTFSRASSPNTNLISHWFQQFGVLDDHQLRDYFPQLGQHGSNGFGQWRSASASLFDQCQ
jgi:hypothetical protein